MSVEKIRSPIYTQAFLALISTLKERAKSGELDEKKAQEISNALGEAVEKSRKAYRKMVFESVDSKMRATLFHLKVDSAISNQKKVDTHSKGIKCQNCFTCCSLQVGVTSDEADLLASLVKNGIEIDLERLEKHKKIKNPDDWAKLTREERRCVFLSNENKCKIYKDRPMTCRLHHSMEDPKNCDIGNEFQAWVSHLGESLASGAFSEVGSESLPEALAKRLHA